MEYVNKLKHQVSEFWNSRNKVQKISLILGALLVILTAGLLGYFISRPSYSPLFTNLSMQDAGEIVKRLEDMKIPYKIADGGKTILVESKDVYKTRLNLAQEGLPKGGVLGFSDIFNKTKLGTTDWERQLQYTQALQGELTRTIEEMEQVESARVHIVQPRESLFIEPNAQKEPSAAVFLKLKPGVEIAEEEIRGIINLVAHSVEGLKPENITIVDEFGRVLSNIPLSEEQNTKEEINSQLVIQNNFQKQLQANVQSLLEQIFGPGNVAVRVNAQLNFDKKTVESRLFTPVSSETGDGILRSVQELREHFSGTGSVPTGNPGTGTNIPGYQQPNTNGTSNYQKTEVIRNYEMNESKENVTVAPGTVKKLTVSVVVNRDLNDEEKDKIATLVGNAIGYDIQRDQITVEGMTFNNQLADILSKQLAEENQRREMQRLLIIISAIAAAILFIIAHRIIAMKRRRMEEEKLAYELAAAQQAASQLSDDVSADNREVFSEIEKLARKRPEDVAKILRTWLNEE
ncbi:flagellar basal-body MS-ring/collar protein FliF [Thermosediminibacter oceani]|uniref:Flagellar M-ring protein n=1 Tax=Thermosediminibacter oceani (strain ATCC BAA-1034 / DSM 16646 / JW/IW-1228P) TaxID=555079 RepID=D9S379_THEOJ|nr:flagellar basal-body MS-ring/collar protein FliF [Thermosediminibacter oceani]ADL07856.1 flagellar M-ring protein FliF [Thermosediminibacter oceani DSM 16646]